uniref:Uncharacterized protein n=1 Tax=Panagrolaimus superbus TaxID=310955 RepID=A0A914Z483_9BILA
MNNDSSLSTSTLNELNLSATSDIQNVSALEYTVSEDTIQNTDTTTLAQESSFQEALQEPSVSLNDDENSASSSDANSTTLSQQSSSPVSTEVAFDSTVNSSIKREFNDSDYCMVIDEPAAKKQKTECNDLEVFPFNLPSNSILKEMCDKLKIDYHRDAYKFWGDIAFENVPVFSQNIQTHSIKSPNIFICLSLFFTGEITKCYSIQDTIHRAFRDELIAKGSNVEKADQLFACTTEFMKMQKLKDMETGKMDL